MQLLWDYFLTLLHILNIEHQHFNISIGKIAQIRLYNGSRERMESYSSIFKYTETPSILLLEASQFVSVLSEILKPW